MQTAVLGRADKLALQASWLNFRMDGHPRWHRDMPVPKQLLASDHKVFVAVHLEDGVPRILDVLRVVDVEASFTAGLTLILASGTDATRLRVSTHPREILPDVFAWVPPFSDVRHCPAKFDEPSSTWRLSVPVYVRTVSEDLIVMTRKEFCERWPNIAL